MAFPAVHNSILVTDYWSKMGINTVAHPPYSPDLAPCDFWLFPKLRGCRYETIEEMKEAVTKVIDTLTQKDFHGVFQKLLEWYKNALQPEEITSKGTRVSIKVLIRKKSGNLFYDPRTLVQYMFRIRQYYALRTSIDLIKENGFTLKKRKKQTISGRNYDGRRLRRSSRAYRKCIHPSRILAA